MTVQIISRTKQAARLNPEIFGRETEIEIGNRINFEIGVDVLNVIKGVESAHEFDIAAKMFEAIVGVNIEEMMDLAEKTERRIQNV